ncbi:MAG: carbamoyltransferase HypF [Planctomycetota bacterium]|nr:MAG: carbamoyltransferase HypF [Planctomycetota bacterium]
MSSNPHAIASHVAVRAILTGRVQGIGVRPTVARLAGQHGLGGYITNTQEGVEIWIEGAPDAVAAFEHALPSCLPVSAEVASFRTSTVIPRGFEAFEIRSSADRRNSTSDRAPWTPTRTCGSGAEAVDRGVESDPSRLLTAHVPPDISVCAACRADIARVGDRRREYAFTGCTDCGPRYSIMHRMPYERKNTSMHTFAMCEWCQQEYASPADRRFHAQTNACPECGPALWMTDFTGRRLAGNEQAIAAAARAILSGRIVALRGLGGYQLLVDATSASAVQRLRERKGRAAKPLAVMVRSLDEADELACISSPERHMLEHPAGPIVILQARSNSYLAPGVSEGLDTVGILLPTTPLHALLLEHLRRAVVCTSCNAEGDPLVVDPTDAEQQLGSVADVFLHHNRPIVRPIDDSVVRCMAGRTATIRLARGLAPLPLPLATGRPLVALGGHQKAALALCNGTQSVLGPHVGDLETLAARRRFIEQFAALTDLYGMAPRTAVADLHPDFFSTHWAEQNGMQVLRVQHHHAHVVAGMLEHGWLDRQVLGVAFDGTGYGMDGTIWGGEFMLATVDRFQRVGCMRPFRLAGGERAVREPWRVATALVRAAVGSRAARQLRFERGNPEALMQVLENPRCTMLTTSVGRLFDGIACLLLGIEQSDFEGQPAMMLESAARGAAAGTEPPIPIPCGPGEPGQGQGAYLDWRPIVRRLWELRRDGADPARLARLFHQSLAVAVAQFCRHFPAQPVVLSGGVFQNRLLVELLAEQFASTNQPLGLPGSIPVNDGGLAVGQLIVGTHVSHPAGGTDVFGNPW